MEKREIDGIEYTQTKEGKSLLIKNDDAKTNSRLVKFLKDTESEITLEDIKAANKVTKEYVTHTVTEDAKLAEEIFKEDKDIDKVVIVNDMGSTITKTSGQTTVAKRRVESRVPNGEGTVVGSAVQSFVKTDINIPKAKVKKLAADMFANINK